MCNHTFSKAMSPKEFLHFFSNSVASFFAGEGVPAGSSFNALVSDLALALRDSSILHAGMAIQQQSLLQRNADRNRQSLPIKTIPALVCLSKNDAQMVRVYFEH